MVTIDMTSTLMPFVWGMNGLLALSVLAIVGSVVLPRIRARWAGRLRLALPVAPRPGLSNRTAQ